MLGSAPSWQSAGGGGDGGNGSGAIGGIDGDGGGGGDGGGRGGGDGGGVKCASPSQIVAAPYPPEWNARSMGPPLGSGAFFPIAKIRSVMRRLGRIFT